MAGPRFIVEVLDSSGSVIGPGPLVNVISIDIVEALDQAGTIRVQVPASDPRAVDLLSVENQIRVKTLDGIEKTAFIHEFTTRAGAQPIFEVSGPDELGELLHFYTGYNRVYDDVDVRAVIIGSDIHATSLLEDTGWLRDDVENYGNASIIYNGETVLQALSMLARQLGRHIRHGSTTRTIDFGVFGADSGLRISNVHHVLVAQEQTDELVLVGDLEIVQSSADIENRLFPLGKSGFDLRDAPETITDIFVQVNPGPFNSETTLTAASNPGDTYLTVNNSSLFVAGETIWIGDKTDWTQNHELNKVTSISVPNTIWLETGCGAYPIGTNVIQRPQFYIEDTTSQASYGVRVGIPSFPWIRPVDPSNFLHRRRAASMLYNAAKAHLTQRAYPFQSYRLGTIYGLPTTLRVGQTIRLVYRGAVKVDGVAVTYVNIDDNFTVLKITRTYNADGSVTASLEIANVDRAVPDNSQMFSGNQETTRWMAISPGSESVVGIGPPPVAHDPVTLDAATGVDDVFDLTGLSGQNLAFDNQNANLVFAGPATGPAAPPTFRAFAAGDMVAHTHSGPGDGGSLAVGVTDTDAAQGAVFFAGADGVLQTNAANLYWNDTTQLLGVGTNGPTYKLDLLAPAGANRNVLRAGVSGVSNGFTITYTHATTDFDYVFVDGTVGIGTVVPHGGIGAALFALEGPNASLSGPHIQVTTSLDDYPLLQFLNWSHDNISIGFDAYSDGTWKSSDLGSNYRLAKVGNVFYFQYATGHAQGAAVSWQNILRLDTNGDARFENSVSIGAAPNDRPLYVYDAATDAVARFASGDANTYIDLKDNATTGDFYVMVGAAGDNLLFVAGGALRARIESTGIYDNVNSFYVHDHDARHILAGDDEIDGDKLGISWNPSNYTPATTPAEVTSIDHLTAHLYGIDQVLASVGGLSDHEHSGPGDGGSLTIGTTDTNATAGSVFFAGTGGVLQQDASNFVWDDSNNRLGVGSTSPSYKVDILSPSGADRSVFRAGVAGVSNGFTVEYTHVGTEMEYKFVGGNVGIKTVPSRSLHVAGTIRTYGHDEAFTGVGWGRNIEMERGDAIVWTGAASFSYAWGIGVTSTPAQMYFFTNTADGASGTPVYVMQLVSGTGIYDNQNGFYMHNHNARHITAGADEIDGDRLDIDWNPSYYTPSTAPAQATSIDNLTAHLYGIDQQLNPTILRQYIYSFGGGYATSSTSFQDICGDLIFTSTVFPSTSATWYVTIRATSPESVEVQLWNSTDSTQVALLSTSSTSWYSTSTGVTLADTKSYRLRMRSSGGSNAWCLGSYLRFG